MSQSGKCSLSIDCGALQRQGGGIVFNKPPGPGRTEQFGEAAAVVAMIDRQIFDGDWQLVLGTQAPEQVRAALVHRAGPQGPDHRVLRRSVLTTARG